MTVEFTDDQMQMPTPCRGCGEWFDLNDGYGSEKWYPNTVICRKCYEKEEREIERDDDIDYLIEQICDAKTTLADCKKSLRDMGVEMVPAADQYQWYRDNKGTMNYDEWKMDGRYDPSLTRKIKENV